MNTIITYIPLLIKGISITVSAWLIAGTVSTLLGFVAGIISCNYLGSHAIQHAIRFYTFIAKGIPAYVQILIAYFVIPELLGISIPGFMAATSALAFCSSGYVTEIVRSGINAIGLGQWQACAVLGYSTKTSLQRIILPQALKTITPALLGELEQLLKSTSLLAAIGVTELTRTGMNIISRELNPLPIYTIIALIYLLLSALLPFILTMLFKKIQQFLRGYA